MSPPRVFTAVVALRLVATTTAGTRDLPFFIPQSDLDTTSRIPLVPPHRRSTKKNVTGGEAPKNALYIQVFRRKAFPVEENGVARAIGKRELGRLLPPLSSPPHAHVPAHQRLRVCARHRRSPPPPGAGDSSPRRKQPSLVVFRRLQTNLRPVFFFSTPPTPFSSIFFIKVLPRRPPQLGDASGRRLDFHARAPIGGEAMVRAPEGRASYGRSAATFTRARLEARVSSPHFRRQKKTRTYYDV